MSHSEAVLLAHVIGVFFAVIIGVNMHNKCIFGKKRP